MIYSAISKNPKIPFHTIFSVSDDRLDITFAKTADEKTEQPQLIEQGGEKVALEIMNHFEIGLSEFWTAQDWKDACIWGIGIIPFSKLHVYNMLADSFAARRPLSKNVLFIPVMTTMKIVVPFTEATFGDMDFFIERPDASSLLIAEGVTELDYAAFAACRDASLPRVVMEGPDSVPQDGYADISAKVFHKGSPLEHPMDVEVESVNGYLPKTRLRVTGSGSFKVGALGLERGDTIKIKAGFRYLGATSEKIITVA